jgi:hypothetical protein
MRSGKLAGAAAVIAAGTCLVPVDEARTGEWGCEVLLCASSSNPSWRGVPACHPPMDRLISAMSNPGFDWPTCPEAGTGRPGYAKYANCPAGWSIGYSDNNRGGRGEPRLCTQVQSSCERDGRDNCQHIVSTPRPLRSDPYFFDIPHADGKTTRHWFSLEE